VLVGRLREEQTEKKRNEETRKMAEGMAPVVVCPEDGGYLESHLHGLYRQQLSLDVASRKKLQDVYDEWEGFEEAEQLTERQAHLETVRYCNRAFCLFSPNLCLFLQCACVTREWSTHKLFLDLVSSKQTEKCSKEKKKS
jgi:hypothetical protein